MNFRVAAHGHFQCACSPLLLPKPGAKYPKLVINGKTTSVGSDTTDAHLSRLFVAHGIDEIWLKTDHRENFATGDIKFSFSPMAPPTKATSKPKKKKPTKKPSIKEQARVKYKKRLQEFKV
jgi:hypothetical protein